jgi:hypothetical protein
MNLPRVGHTGTLLSNGKVLVTGGRNDTGVINNESELYDPADGTWGITGFMNTQRVGHASVPLNNGKVLTCGGLSVFYSGYLPTAELYDPLAGTWSATGPINFARYNHTATLLKSGYVLIVGGDVTNGYTSSASFTIQHGDLGVNGRPPRSAGLSYFNPVAGRQGARCGRL